MTRLPGGMPCSLAVLSHDVAIISCMIVQLLCRRQRRFHLSHCCNRAILKNRSVVTREAGGTNSYDIFTVRPHGTDLKQLTHAPGNDANCAWSRPHSTGRDATAKQERGSCRLSFIERVDQRALRSTRGSLHYMSLMHN